MSTRVCDRCGGPLDPTEGIHEITTVVYRGPTDDDVEPGTPRVRVYCHRCGLVVLREQAVPA